MNIRKRLAGVEGFTSHTLFVVGLDIQFVEMNIQNDEFQEVNDVWETWDWLVFYQLNEKKISKEQFVELYDSLNRKVTDFNFEYRDKDNQQAGFHFAKLYEDIQLVIYPHLPSVFPPTNGRRDTRSRFFNQFASPADLEKKFLSGLQIVADRHGFETKENSSASCLMFICAKAMIQILVASNEETGRRRMAARISAYDILPFLLCFEFFKFKRT